MRLFMNIYSLSPGSESVLEPGWRVRVQVCDVLERIALADNHGVWRGSEDSDLSQVSTGITVLGTPLVDLAFVESQLEVKIEQQRTLSKRIFVVPYLQ